MRLFSRLYERVMTLSRHPRAPRYLAALSFAESSFFPIPPDVMLAPMSLADPLKAWRFALLTTLASVLGGILGYLIGAFAFEAVKPLLIEAGYGAQYERVQSWFGQWGFWAIFVAGFSPIPFKIFTITAGVISMAFVPFVVAAAIGRGARFFLVSALMVWGGERMEGLLRKYVDAVGWLVVLLTVVVLVMAQE
jgi:membrane protein YqaA with SNARE-associated domain